MAVKIRAVRKCVDDNGIKILVHGLAGSGKTVLCATTGEPTLIISSERGLLSIRDAPAYIKAAEIENLDDLQDMLDFLKEDAEEKGDERAFKWVALDSISDIAETVLAYEKSVNKDPRAAYGNLQDHVLRILREFRDLPGYNVIMTCKQERVSNDGVNIYSPLMPGAKLAHQIPYLFDEVFALRVEKDADGDEYRVLQTRRDAKYDAKDRSGVLEVFEKPSLKAIARKIRAGLETEGSAPIVEEEEVEEVITSDIEEEEDDKAVVIEEEEQEEVVEQEDDGDNEDHHKRVNEAVNNKRKKS